MQQLKKMISIAQHVSRLVRASWRQKARRKPSDQSGLCLPPPVRVRNWIRANHLSTGGIRVQGGHPNAYPEVTGYLIPTLLKCGDYELATKLTEWLLCIQRADGSFPDPDTGRSYIFDTGQVLRGLLAATHAKLIPDTAAAARRAADYLLAQLLDGGRKGFPLCYSGTDIPETVHLYVLPPLVEVASLLRSESYREAAQSCLNYYILQPGFLRICDLTHFLAYQLEALIDLGRADLAGPVLERLRQDQKRDGAVRGVGGVDWVCSPGLAQLAICWYKSGQWEPADRALSWLEEHQEADGGFKGSYGPKAAYKQDVEISWTGKFYLDAHFLRVDAFFTRHTAIFPTTIAPSDELAQAILQHVQSGNKVLEVGCGRGRFLSVVKIAFPDTDCMGVGPSLALPNCLPTGITGMPGNRASIHCSNDLFDVTFSVEAIENSINPARAVEEMVRVTKPGGWVIIVDKQQAKWGRLQCLSWERWPESGELKALLNRHCDDVTAQAVAYDDRPASDGLMVAWCGRKRSRLSGAQWNTVLIAPDLEETVVETVRFNRFSEWGRAVLLQTKPGETVLEIGSGTGQISLQLAQAGRVVTCLDTSNDSLAFTQRCALHLGLSLQTQCTDATRQLPFDNRQFDCVWSSGLLEHFSEDERRDMLREWARVCRGKLINLVPNAACLCYRLGKRSQEHNGSWPYGLEIPLQSLRTDYEAAGVRVVDEFSIGTQHALEFLATEDPQLKQRLTVSLRGVSDSELADWNQGYLLVTVGHCDER